MATHQTDGPFLLSPLPDELWDMARMIREFRVDHQTIRRRVREGKLPGPCLHRNGRAFWNPAVVESYRRNRLHPSGPKCERPSERPTPTASLRSICNRLKH